MFILEFFKVILYQPLYNALVFLIDIVPGHEVGFAIILLTILVKTILLPVAHKTIKSQKAMRDVSPEIKDLKAKKLDRQVEAMQTMELYKKRGVNPFSGCLLLLIQLPIIITLYLVFLHELPTMNPSLLYSFIPHPEAINTIFLGFFELKNGSIILALLAGCTQFFQMKVSMPPIPPKKERKEGEVPNFQEEFSRNMSMQMKYILPVFIVVAAYSLSAAIAIYWITNNLFTLIHELIVQRSTKNTP